MIGSYEVQLFTLNPTYETPHMHRICLKPPIYIQHNNSLTSPLILSHKHFYHHSLNHFNTLKGFQLNELNLHSSVGLILSTLCLINLSFMCFNSQKLKLTPVNYSQLNRVGPCHYCKQMCQCPLHE